jgi:hypothetical protein
MGASCAVVGSTAGRHEGLRYTLMTVLERRVESLMTVAKSTTAATAAMRALVAVTAAAAAAAAAAAPVKTERQEF